MEMDEDWKGNKKKKTGMITATSEEAVEGRIEETNGGREREERRAMDKYDMTTGHESMGRGMAVTTLTGKNDQTD